MTLRCCFCGKMGFMDLDDIYSHQITINSYGISLCSFIKRLDGRIWEKEILPLLIGDNKFAPKNDKGEYIYYDSKGNIINKPLLSMYLRLYS